MQFISSIAGWLGAAALALAASGAQASYVKTVIDFEQNLDTSALFIDSLLAHDDILRQDGYTLQTFSLDAAAGAGNLVGALVGGSSPDEACAGILCPRSTSRYLAALNGSAVSLVRHDASVFRLERFDAAFVAGIPSTVPSIPLVVRTLGFLSGNIAYQFDAATGGLFNNGLDFATVITPAPLKQIMVDTVLFVGLGCDVSGLCRSGLTSAQFALDDITASVPEPQTWALLGLALIGATASRRRAGSRRTPPTTVNA